MIYISPKTSGQNSVVYRTMSCWFAGLILPYFILMFRPTHWKSFVFSCRPEEKHFPILYLFLKMQDFGLIRFPQLFIL